MVEDKATENVGSKTNDLKQNYHSKETREAFSYIINNFLTSYYQLPLNDADSRVFARWMNISLTLIIKFSWMLNPLSDNY